MNFMQLDAYKLAGLRTRRRLKSMGYRRSRPQTGMLSRKQDFRDEHDGRLFCEACCFEFANVYDIRGAEDYIEAHHTKPVSELEGDHLSSIRDLVMLCANCHRMIHRGTSPLTVDELKRRI